MKIKDVNYGCKDKGNDDGVSVLSANCQSVGRGICDVKDGGVSDCEGCGKVK